MVPDGGAAAASGSRDKPSLAACRQSRGGAPATDGAEGPDVGGLGRMCAGGAGGGGSTHGGDAVDGGLLAAADLPRCWGQVRGQGLRHGTALAV